MSTAAHAPSLPAPIIGSSGHELLMGIENPLLDISAVVPVSFMDK